MVSEDEKNKIVKNFFVNTAKNKKESKRNSLIYTDKVWNNI